MKKIKWMLLNTPLSLTVMHEKLKKNSYNEEKGKGFIFDKVRDNELKGRYVEKLVYQDIAPSLYGERTTIDRVEYRIVEFYIHQDSLPIIAIINPPRTLKPFVINLVKVLGFGISLEEIDIEPMTWVDSIAKTIPLELIQIEFSQIRFADNALAKMQISSSSDLLKLDDKHFHKLENSRVDRVIVSMVSPTYTGKVKITRSGLAVIETKHEKLLSDVLFKSLFGSIKI